MDELHYVLIGSMITLEYNEVVQNWTVVKHKRNTDEFYIGTKNDNPILDTRIYQVSFSDREILRYQLTLYCKIYTVKWIKMTTLESI